LTFEALKKIYVILCFKVISIGDFLPWEVGGYELVNSEKYLM